MFIYEAWAYKSLNCCDKNVKAINNIIIRKFVVVPF